MLRTVKYPDPILTTPCQPYDFAQVDARLPVPKLHELLDEMTAHMVAENGIGLAANQVGIGYRIFVMKDQKGKIWEFINPEITDRDDFIAIDEGCLSAPGVTAQVSRSKSIVVKAQDRMGQEFKVACEDVEAVCVQHEIDHLDGIFFLSKTSRNQRRAALRALGLKNG